VFGTLQTVSTDLSVWDEALGRTLADVEAEAESLVRQHITRTGGSLSERWLSEGLQYVSTDTCPMCASGIEGSVLIRAYRTYFSDAYTRLKTEIAAARASVQKALAGSAIDAISATTTANQNLAPFWISHGVECPTAPPMEAAQAALSDLRDAYERAFEQKLGNVLEAVSVGPEADEQKAILVAAAEAIREYNTAAIDANSAIAAVKGTAATNSLTNALERLRLLRNGQVRHSAEGDEAVAALKAAKAEKKKLEVDKRVAREALENATQTLFANYQDRINKHLVNCGCGYKITNTKTVYTGGKSRTDYQLEINSQIVDLAGPKTGIAPSFKNTLSDGDKSALAFAFFLAKLELDPGLANKIVVLDDPMTSLDAHRRTYTCERIVKLVPLCRQVMLLTHDAQFARQVWDGLPKSKKALHIDEVNGRSRIAEWDILRATRSDYFARHDLISEFLRTGLGDRTAVAVSLRLLLEGNLRMRFPEHFGPNEWLGDFIKRVRSAGSGDYLAALQSKLDELTSVNDYAKQFHHDQNPTAALVKPVDAELKAYARRALDLAAGLP
jgi:wobble nucleotide-excising tRNase